MVYYLRRFCLRAIAGVEESGGCFGGRTPLSFILFGDRRVLRPCGQADFALPAGRLDVRVPGIFVSRSARAKLAARVWKGR